MADVNGALAVPEQTTKNSCTSTVPSVKTPALHYAFPAITCR